MLGGYRLQDVSRRLGVDFDQGSFAYGMSNDPAAMMGGGVCWLDYNGDGRLDLFAVNSYDDPHFGSYTKTPTSALFQNTGHGFVNVSRARTRRSRYAARAASRPTWTATATPTST